MAKGKIDRRTALALARDVAARIAPVCDRVEIAGSLRRGREQVGDIEIVAIPQYERDLLGGQGESRLGDLRALLGGMCEGMIKDGPKYKQAILQGGISLDLFLTTAECWGVIFALRTGSAEYSRRLVTHRSRGGLLPDDCAVQDGRVWRGARALETPEEQDFLNLCGGYCEPWERVF